MNRTRRGATTTPRPTLLSEADRDEIRAKLRADATLYAKRLAELESDDINQQDHSTVRSLRATLTEVQEALIRTDSARYGYCTQCGRWIAVARLLALPHTRHCIECAATS
ncbi:TraR/DksA family transcriptional regulator [Desertimonas flava]|uniref:TraR/DksA family transcriptional regulator n=1 Tax=Desertimonas flava TaxID=2064846 RepID=UPI0013C433D1|nr:TraR/DksA C4-type zinc finger protein [Desertimonas flava]